MSRELGSIEIAERNGIDRRTALRWLKAIHAEYGSSVVARRGKRGVFVTTEDAFARVAPLVAKRAGEERRIRELEERLSDTEKRLDKVVAEQGELRRQLSFQFLRAK